MSPSVFTTRMMSEERGRGKEKASRAEVYSGSVPAVLVPGKGKIFLKITLLLIVKSV
jgi:hypothetical protein